MIKVFFRYRLLFKPGWTLLVVIGYNRLLWKTMSAQHTCVDDHVCSLMNSCKTKRPGCSPTLCRGRTLSMIKQLKERGNVADASDGSQLTHGDDVLDGKQLQPEGHQVSIELSLQEETSCDLGWGSAASFPDEIIQALFKYLPFAFDLQGPEQGSDQEKISGMMIQKNNVSQRPHWAASTSPGLSDFPSATSKKERKKEGRKEVFDCRSDLTNASSDRQKSFNLLIHCQKKLHWIFGNWPIDVG